MDIQKILDSLQPYLISIRYIDKTPVVDVVLKEGWILPEDEKIKKVKGDEGMNYYMLYSEDKLVSLDNLLDFVKKTIKLNLDREEKHELLKTKIDELKILFKKNQLEKLKNLKFLFNEEKIDSVLSDIDYETEELIEPEKPQIKEEITNLTEEEKEILEEEARGERNRKIIKDSKNKIVSKVELPPKQKAEKAIEKYANSDCECGPTEACNYCIEEKDL